MEADARHELVISAVCSVAHRHGIEEMNPTIIKDSNNTVVDLGVENLVAKVATSTLPGHSIDAEFRVLKHLHNKRGPTARLSDRIEHGPHTELGCRLFFLERLQLTNADINESQAMETVLATHDALGDFTFEIPDFLRNLTTTEALFHNPTLTPELPKTERTFCATVATWLREQFDGRTWETKVLHGDPWIGGNLVNTTDGPRLIDFEAVCRGPIEWDLSSFLDKEIDSIDKDLFGVCRLLRSFTVSAFCWAQPGRAPEVDEAALWHLNALHTTLGR